MSVNSARILVVLLVGVVAASHVEAAPKARLVDAHWALSNEDSIQRVDHAGWDTLLKSYISVGADGVHRFDYGGISAADSASLEAYLERLSGTASSQLSRGEQLAYWINLYNALTVRTVIAHYPVKSILKVRPTSFLSPGPWKRDLITVDGRALSLDDIEHGILRPIWRDPRIHYAVNCASIGCPNLAKEAFAADTAQRMLAEAARSYVNHPRGVSVEDGRLAVSRIYSWYAKDFGDSDEKVIAHIREHADPDLAAALTGVRRIGKYRYDWSLNDVDRSDANE